MRRSERHLQGIWMSKLERPLFSHAAAPPRIEKRRVDKTVHGVTLSDDFAWLRASNWQEVLCEPDALPHSIRAVIEAENAYALEVLAPAATLCAALVKEMRGRIKEDDSEVPNEDGPWCYVARHNRGAQHPV